MRMDKLTTKFQLALADAQSLAVGRDHQYIEPVHLLMALLDQDGGTARPLLAQAGVNINRLRLQLMEALDRMPQVEGTGGELHVSNDLGKLLNLTDKLAQGRKDHYVSSELFLLAAVEDKGEVGALLRDAGGTKGAIEQAIDQVRGGERVDDPNAEEQRQALDLLGNIGFDPIYGARPLKRVIQQRLENPLAQQILAGSFAPGDTIHAEAEKGGLIFTATR